MEKAIQRSSFVTAICEGNKTTPRSLILSIDDQSYHEEPHIHTKMYARNDMTLRAVIICHKMSLPILNCVCVCSK